MSYDTNYQAKLIAFLATKLEEEFQYNQELRLTTDAFYFNNRNHAAAR